MSDGAQSRNLSSIPVRGVDSDAIESLSGREREVLSLAATGRIDKEICAELGISPNTLRTYWARIRAKLGEVPRSALAVALSQDLGSRSGQSQQRVDWEVDLVKMTLTSYGTGSASDEDEGVAVPFDDAIATVHPDDADRFRRFLLLLDTNDLQNFSYTLRVAEGDSFTRTTSFVRVIRNSSGRAVKLLGTKAPLLDFQTPQQDRVEVGYWSRDLVTNKFSADDSYCALYGIDPNDPDMRQKAIQRFHPDDRHFASTILDRSVKERKRHFRFTHRMLGPGGVYRWAMCDVRIEYDDDVPIRALGTAMVFDPD